MLKNINSMTLSQYLTGQYDKLQNSMVFLTYRKLGYSVLLVVHNPTGLVTFFEVKKYFNKSEIREMIMKFMYNSARNDLLENQLMISSKYVTEEMIQIFKDVLGCDILRYRYGAAGNPGCLLDLHYIFNLQLPENRVATAVKDYNKLVTARVEKKNT